MSDAHIGRRLLIADDDEITRLFLVETLERAGFSTVAVADGVAALDAVQTEEFSLALIDIDMPHLDGFSLCRVIRSAKALQFLPVVMITGNDDEVSVTRAYEAGATDFIAKPVNWALLPHRVHYILRNALADRRLRHLAFHDSLTGLPNARALVSWVAAALEQAAAGGDQGVALLHVGVERCTRIRSVFGPNEGDAALRAISERLTACTNAFSGDGERLSIARIDGDRFAVGLRDRLIREQAANLSEQLSVAFTEPVICGQHRYFVPPAIGIAWSPDHGNEAESLMTHAAAAKHHAIAVRSTHPVTYSEDIGSHARARLELESELRQAVSAELLTLYYQPKIRLSDQSLTGVEALLRWFDSELGEVSPATFVPLAEESGLILDIGRWVIKAACRQLGNWRDQGFETRMAINLSAAQFMHDDPAKLIREAACASQINPCAIIVEITESAVINDLARIQAGLQSLRNLGCQVAIDDFGTGYSSLAYLKRLPVDELKIDRSFIGSLGVDNVDAAICTAVLALARSVGLSTTAEGVETEEQLEWLRRHDCTEAQGFLIARPMSGHELFRRFGDSGRIAAKPQSAVGA